MYFPRLKDLRKDRDLTQKQIGEYLWISQRTYSSYETGKRNIPFDVFIALAMFYKVSLDYLAGLTDEKKPYERKKK